MTDEHDTLTATLPTPGAGPQMRMLPLGSIAASRTNPRKVFNSGTLQELANSISASGVHQPILVRPLPAARLEDTSRATMLKPGTQQWPLPRVAKPLPIEYELVAGERRWRACQIAGLVDVPAMIRELTDEQALEIQVIENLQREDVTELEEAEGYEALMMQGKINADQVGAKIGKSRSYVYARLKLLDLCPTAREALREGKIDASKGLLIARIPDEGLQVKALHFCTDTNWENDPPSYRECARHIQNEYMLRLDKARFPITDASLAPPAPSCTDCPKRTGANPDLFKDVDSADVCTDPKCYRNKEDAYTAAVAAQAQASGHTVIAGTEAAELVYDGYHAKLKGYKRLDSADDSPTDQPLRKIIGKQMEAEGIKPTMIENPRKRGELLACLPNEVALRLLKAVEGQAKATKEVAAEVKEMVKNKEAKALEKAKAKYEQAWRNRLLDLAWAQIEGQMPYQFTSDVHRYVLRREINSLSQEDAAALANILNLGKVAAHNALQEFALSTRSPDQLHLLVIMQRDSNANDHAYIRPKNEGLMLVAGIALGDGFDAAVKDSQAIAAAEHLPSPTTAPAKPDNTEGQEGTSTPPPAAQASSSRAKGKKSRGPATHGGEVPKTSAAHAAALIAAELEALEAQDQAPAAQGDEAPPAPTGGDAPATHSDAAADASTGATVESGNALRVGGVATVRETSANAKWRGRKVMVLSIGATIKVRQADTPSNKAERGSFFEEDLEVAA